MYPPHGVQPTESQRTGTRPQPIAAHQPGTKHLGLTNRGPTPLPPHRGGTSRAHGCGAHNLPPLLRPTSPGAPLHWGKPTPPRGPPPRSHPRRAHPSGAHPPRTWPNPTGAQKPMAHTPEAHDSPPANPPEANSLGPTPEPLSLGPTPQRPSLLEPTLWTHPWRPSPRGPSKWNPPLCTDTQGPTALGPCSNPLRPTNLGPNPLEPTNNLGSTNRGPIPLPPPIGGGLPLRAHPCGAHNLPRPPEGTP